MLNCVRKIALIFVYISYRQADVDYTDARYKVNNDYEDQLRLHGDIKFKELQGRDDKKGRNFAWEVKESSSKT